MKGSAPNPKLFAILAGVTLVGGLGACYWQYGQIGDLSGKVASLKKEDKDDKTVQAELAAALESLSEGQAKLDHLEKSVSQAAYVPTLLKELETAGRGNGIAVLGVRPIPKVEVKDKEGKPVRDKKPYTELGIEVRGRGNYRAVLSFVNALQTFPKIVAAKTISLTPKNDPTAKATGVNLEVTIELKTYLFAPAKEEEKKTVRRESDEKVNHG